MLLLPCVSVYGQVLNKEENFKILFAQGCSIVDSNFCQNNEELKRLIDFLELCEVDPNISISKITVDSHVSPEGGRAYNKRLAQQRTDSLSNYLIAVFAMPCSLIERKYSGTNWDGLLKLVDSSYMEYRYDVRYIITKTPEETWRKAKPTDRWVSLVDSRLKQLQDLGYGAPYRYMSENYFPSLRGGSVTISYTETIPEPIVKADSTAKKPEEESEVIEQSETTITEEHSRKPIKLALKTNLLYDMLLAPSFELEVPIGRRWSVAAEWVFPWWTLDDGTKNSARCRLQVLNANLEAKYWFGDREALDYLTGWHCGVYAGAGLYDVEYKAKGYQGEFAVAGLTGGYAHTINQSGSLRLEYSMSLGCLRTRYRGYKAEWAADNIWHPVRGESGTYTWIGPTRLRLSLVWMIGQSKRKETARE